MGRVATRQGVWTAMTVVMFIGCHRSTAASDAGTPVDRVVARDRPRPTDAPHANTAMPMETLPIPLERGAFLAGRSYAAGTLAVGWVLPDHGHVDCLSRDRGASWRCRRLTPPEGVTAVSLVSNTGPEDLWLFERPGRTWLAAPREPAVEAFAMTGAVVPSLAMGVVGEAWFATLVSPRGGRVSRVLRGQPRVEQAPPELATGHEATVVFADTHAYWFGVSSSRTVAELKGRWLRATGAIGAAVSIAELPTGPVLLDRCQSATRGYVLASGAGGSAVLVTVRADETVTTARVTDVSRGTMLACDDEEATVRTGTRVRHCLGATCTEAVGANGVRAMARTGGHLVNVSIGEGARPAVAIDEEAPHAMQGLPRDVQADEVWLFEAGGRLVLFSIGTATTVWWSDDGRAWSPAREAFEPPSRVSLDVGRQRH